VDRTAKRAVQHCGVGLQQSYGYPTGPPCTDSPKLTRNGTEGHKDHSFARKTKNEKHKIQNILQLRAPPYSNPQLSTLKYFSNTFNINILLIKVSLFFII
jgi:hypothetical protein